MHKKIPKKAVEKTETIFEYEARLKREAREIAATHVDDKPIRYLLKR